MNLHPSNNQPDRGPLRALVVEDCEDDVTLLEVALRGAGYAPSLHRVETADGMRAALDGEPWDLVISDYVMPSFDAPGAIAVLQESGRRIPLIVVSGTIGEDVAVETLKLGADDYLLKQNLTRLVPAIERALVTAEERRRHERTAHMKTLIMANSMDLICTLDGEGRFVEVSAAARNILGYAPEEMLGRDVLEFVHPDDREATRVEAETIMGGRPTTDFENRYVRKDGGVVAMMWSAFWSQPDEVLIGVGRDVTERKAERVALRLTLERLQLAIKASRVGIWEIDLATQAVTWDERMRNIYGEVGEGMDVERWCAAILPEDLARMREMRDSAMEERREGFETEFRIVRRDDGGERFIRSMCTILRNGNGEALRMIGVNWDVTEEHLRSQELERALRKEQALAREAQAGERAKSEFLAVMSHEIRTPMNGVLGFAELLAQAPSLPEDCRGHAEIIVQSGESLLRILDDILDFSRLEAGRVDVERAEFSPRELLVETRALLMQSAADKGLHLHVVIAPEVPPVLRGDAGRLRQILLNLVGNAIKFTERGSVTMGLRLVGDLEDDEMPEFEFSVRDTGPGVSPVQIELIFHPFTQADSTISRRFGGTGLGLTISRRLTELLGGRLEVRSEPGEGAEFLVTVPLGKSDPATIPEPPPPLVLDRAFAEKYPLKILLIEDDQVNLKLVLTLIRRLGYEPIAARNGREAVEIYRNEKPDCLLMDLQMPELDGIEATARIRALERVSGFEHRAFIAALTANIFPAERERCFEAGMDGYLNKPVKLADLAEMLTRARIVPREEVKTTA
jgi:PAS domain S-box-containing protein